MNRIEKLFKEKNGNILSVYFTAGFPEVGDTERIINQLQNSGVDLIEIGIPFSDPLADGPTIQYSNEVALKNGMTVKILFDQLKNIRKSITVPLVLMSYFNPVLQYGIENFCRNAFESGIDGVIIPDLPVQNYLDEYKTIFEKNYLFNILLITPQTSESRIRIIDDNSKGFIYMVSSSSITGTKSEISDIQREYFIKVKKMNLKNPILIGFGISDRNTFNEACQFGNGAIIGSSFIRAIQKNGELNANIRKFINDIKDIQQ